MTGARSIGRLATLALWPSVRLSPKARNLVTPSVGGGGVTEPSWSAEGSRSLPIVVVVVDAIVEVAATTGSEWRANLRRSRQSR